MYLWGQFKLEHDLHAQQIKICTKRRTTRMSQYSGTASLPLPRSPTPVELYLRPVNATGHKSQPAVEPEIGVQLPKQQLPGLRRQNSNFPFSILLPPSPSPYTIRFMILLHLRILRCRYRCRCPTDLWRNEPFRSLRLLLCQDRWKYGKAAAYSKLKQRTKRPWTMKLEQRIEGGISSPWLRTGQTRQGELLSLYKRIVCCVWVRLCNFLKMCPLCSPAARAHFQPKIISTFYQTFLQAGQRQHDLNTNMCLTPSPCDYPGILHKIFLTLGHCHSCFS